MAGVEELEATLQAQWDVDTAAVYADALIERGDPRGELIAIDLQIARQGATAEVMQRRREFVIAWLGAEAAGAYSRGDTRFGLIAHRIPMGPLPLKPEHELTALFHGEVAALWVSASRPYLRSLTLAEYLYPIEGALTRLATLPMPWLRELTITAHGSIGASLALGPMNDFVAAAPHLRALSLTNEVMRPPIHPQIRTLRVPIDVLRDDVAMPHLTELDLAFGDWRGGSVDLRLFPSLERLDLSRNDPGDAFRFIAAHDALDRVAQIRISLGRDRHTVAMIHLLERRPELEITVAKTSGYTVPDSLRHPRLHLVSNER